MIVPLEKQLAERDGARTMALAVIDGRPLPRNPYRGRPILARLWARGANRMATALDSAGFYQDA